jgi:GNAT superfamily N-acetyltransferase
MAIRQPAPGLSPLGAPLVRPLRPDEWMALRELRLRALQAVPDAFEETYEQARARSDDDWCALVAACDSGGRVILLCEDGDGGAAIASVRLEGGESPPARLSNMWVEPRARRGGFGRAVLEAGERWAAERGARELRLWVNEANEPAIRLYERAGYERTGRWEPLRPGSPIVTVELARAIDS